ncbi:MAG: enoyl-CoA hydratase/isomerase family protein [Leptospiraceae bacterium]|nr:enoyl-CoA hydratase/isomerase family protein [Leptospiraceae bacterium]
MSAPIFFEKTQQNAGAINLNSGPTNAFSAEALNSLSSALDEAHAEGLAGNIKSLLLLSQSPGYFSAGLDLNALDDSADLSGLLGTFYSNLQKLYTMPVPVISGIRGHALGYGCMLALMGDYRLLVESGARVGLPEVKLGLRIPRIVIEEYQKVVGYSEANRQVLEGTAMKPDEALRCGYADSLHPEDEIESKCYSVAGKFKKLSSGGLASIRAASRVDASAFAEILKRDLEENLKSLNHPDAREGLSAAREGRRPSFTGPAMV